MPFILPIIALQAIGARLCGASFNDPSVPVCYAIVQSPSDASRIELQAFDKASNAYLTTQWNGDTMLSRLQSPGTCVEWQNADWTDIEPCS